MRRSWLLLLLAGCTPETLPPDGPGQTCRFLGTLEQDGPPVPAAPDGRCVVVGTVNPLSGPLGPVGFALENAARLAVKDVNLAGGAGGQKLCLAACDDRTDPATDEAIVRELVDLYGAVAINGAAASASTLEAARAAKLRAVPLVSCCSTSAQLTEDPLIFRTVPSDALQGVVLANVARSLPEPADRVAVIYVDDAYGSSLRQVFERAFLSLGGTVVASVPYTANAPEYLSVVIEALEDEPRHVVLIAFPTDGAQIMRDWRDSGLGPRTAWLATDGLRDDKFVQGTGGLAAGVIGTAPLLRGGRYGSFDRRYRAAFGNEAPGIFTSNQYDAMLLIALGIARTGGGAQGVQLREAIREASRPPGALVSPDDVPGALAAAEQADVDYSGASGEVELDDRGDVVSDYEIWEVRGASLVDRPECWSCALAGEEVSCSRRSC